jgi:hypothetical protein
MMQNLNKQQPAATATRGIAPAQPLKPVFPNTAPPKTGGNAAQMYQALFPNDTLGNIIQQQKQMPQ